MISGEASRRGRYTNIDGATIKVVTKGAGHANGGSAPSSGNARETYWEDRAKQDEVKEERYNRRAAYMFAKDVVLAMVAKDLLDIPKAKNKQLETILASIDMIAEDYTEIFINGAQPGGEIPAEEEVQEDAWGDES